MKKERYFTQQNQSQKVTEWKEELSLVKHHRPFEISLEHALLIVLDMQNVFLDEISHAFVPSAPEIVPNIQNLINFFHKKDLPIIATQHSNSLDSTDPMNIWWKNSILNDSYPFLLTNLLKFPKSTIFLQKHQYSAFYRTSLESILKKKRIDFLVITGVMTHLCCETTARDAFMRGFRTFIAIDGTATYTEKFHLGSLRALSHGFSICGSYQELMKK